VHRVKDWQYLDVDDYPPKLILPVLSRVKDSTNLLTNDTHLIPAKLEMLIGDI